VERDLAESKAELDEKMSDINAFRKLEVGWVSIEVSGATY
jgi:hypothetical protein